MKNILKNNCALKIIIKDDLNESVKRDMEILRLIELSTIVIFCLTNQYIESNEFLIEYKHAKYWHKVILFILMENIEPNSNNSYWNALDESNVIRIYKNNDTPLFKENIWFSDEFFKLISFIYTTFGRQNLISFDRNTKNIELCRINWYKNELDLINYKKISCLTIAEIKVLKEIEIDINTRLLNLTNQLVTFLNDEFKCKFKVYEHNKQNIYNAKEVVITDKNLKKSIIVGICYVRALNQFFTINNENRVVSVLDHNLISIKEITPKLVPSNKCFKAIDYNEQNKLIYLLDEFSIIAIGIEDFKLKTDYYFASHKAVKFKLANNLIYVLDTQLVFVYSHILNENGVGDIQFVTKFGYTLLNNACDLVYSPVVSSCRDGLLFVLELNEPYLKAFNLTNYEFIGSIQFSNNSFDDIHNYSATFYHYSIYVQSSDEIVQIRLEF